MKTTLTEDEMKIAYNVGKSRNDFCKNNNIFSGKHSSRSNFWIDWNGAAGEIAFAKMMFESKVLTKKEFDLCILKIQEGELKSANLGLDDGDLSINNLNIDVKTSEYDFAHLWLTNNKRNTCKIDYYVLLTGNVDKSPSFELKGYLSHKTAMKNWNDTISGTPGKFHQKELKQNIFEGISE